MIWNPDEIIFSIGTFAVRWYSFFWCLGLLVAYFLVARLYKQQGIAAEKFEPLFLYAFLGILIGARLGHCLLYEPAYFLAHPIEMLLPIRETADGWRCTGYAGLASHGGTAGLIFALWLYVRKTKVGFLRVIDNIGIATPFTAGCIRMGNLMNSEIVGKATDSPLGFVFANNGEDFARYPAQLFEAVAYFAFFIGGLLLYRRFKDKVGTGFYFGYCLATIFTFRFFIEILKEVQEPWELDMMQMIGLNQGQLLSIPFALIGTFALCGGLKRFAQQPLKKN